MKLLLLFLCILLGLNALAQKDSLGVLAGNVLGEKGRALEGATVRLIPFTDSNAAASTITASDGSFRLEHLAFGYYRLHLSYSGRQPLTLDSIYFRADRFDFNLNDLVLHASDSAEKMDEVVVYAEKPLIQSKDGNITFNAAESALSAGSNASELLTNVPLVTKDPSGKLMVRGKEPKILIDDKPVELNAQQLQDLLESMPGSSIDRIEVLTNPPPQYATEEGGVINIVTRKGTIGMNGRLSMYGGTRGEAGMNASFNYRKQGLTISVNAGGGYNYFRGGGHSMRENLYADSVNFFNTASHYANKSLRPNIRASINYDLNSYNSLSLVLQYNHNHFDNRNVTEYQNINRNHALYKLNDRTIGSSGDNSNPYAQFGYLLKTRKPGEQLRITADINSSTASNARDLYQQYFNTDHTPNGRDSTQMQQTDNHTNGYSVRLNYDLPLRGNKTFLSAGGFFTSSAAHIASDAQYLHKPDGAWIPLTALINEFRYHQYVNNFRGSVKQVLGTDFNMTAGLSAERTLVRFELYRSSGKAGNDYWNYMPFATISKTWREKLNLSLTYRRTVRRPGVTELNPTIDSSDAYNLRSGNIALKPSLSHQFDLVIGRTKSSFYANLGLGYNIVDDVFSQIRTRTSDTTTRIQWENISGRREYQLSGWSGYSVSKRVKVNFSASYTYSKYSAYDKAVRNYRDGGSFTSNLNTNYVLKDLYTATGSFTFNRFANPQGTVRGTLSMNIGLQAKLLRKKMVLTFNIIDPFVEQESRSYTYGTNFNLQSFSTTQTRNYRLTVGYNFARKQKRKPGMSKGELLNKLSVGKQ